MDIPQLSSCFGLSLKRGALTIGWVTVVCSVTIAAAAGAVLAALGYLELRPNIYRPLPRPDLPQLPLLSLLIVTIHLLRAALAALLLLGVLHDRPTLVAVWTLFSLVAALVVAALNVLLAITYRQPDLAAMLALPVHLYCALVTHSYYRLIL